ncbi:MAG: haloacid dehalogenase-like hydrolase [Deltaproteobacteria bacterium]|nr:MAG: haloacid dehalogenase-like hydrolase [Deltaproteobacteria bacterium]
MPSIAFFDVDRTLMDGYSGYYTTLLLIKKRLMKKRRLVQAFFYKAMSHIAKVDLKKIYEIACMDLAGMSLEDILKVGEESFLKDIKKRLYLEAIAKVQEHRKKGDYVYLVTSAPYMTIEHLSRFLQVDGHLVRVPLLTIKKSQRNFTARSEKPYLLS